MERRVFLMFLIYFLGIISAALGIAAEFKRIKESDIQYFDSGNCAYPRSEAYDLGFAAVLVLVVAHAIINVSVCCTCCNRASRTGRVSCDFFFAVFSWLTFYLACIPLVDGSIQNDWHTVDDPKDFCYQVLSSWVFVKGAGLSLLSVMSGVLYYSSVSMPNTNQRGTPIVANNNGTIAMAQPQVPAQQPVLVPEDECNRREQMV